MALTPVHVKRYHVFLASPGDVSAERQHVRQFFDEFNRSTAHLWNAELHVVDWENYATIGVGRPQELITQQTLEKYKDSLALVVGILGQRFGSPTGKAESGTEEEFNWAVQCHHDTGFPEIKWFFRNTGKIELPDDPDEADRALDQWKRVRAFRQRMQDLSNPVFYASYPGADGFGRVFDRDLRLWLADPARPWVVSASPPGTAPISASSLEALPVDFDSERYRAAVRAKFDKVNLDMLDMTGAYYGVRLWSVFVPQMARECHEYNPRILEIPKEHQQRLLRAGEITAQELAAAEQQADALRRKYFNQPLRPVLDVVGEALQSSSSQTTQRVVILGDPGSGKSSLIRYLALRWAAIDDRALRDTQPIPLVIDLASYGRWQCKERKGFIRFLEEGPIGYVWKPGLLARLLQQPGRIVLLLDGLDELFETHAREVVLNDIQRFSGEHPQTPIVVTSRWVGYQPQRLRDAEFRHFMLQDLDAKQIRAFVDRWHEHTFDSAEQAAPKRERLKKAIQGSKSIAMLAGNPLLLTMMAILNRSQELPRGRVDLYDRASRVLLEIWDTERALADFPGLSAEIGWREKTDMLRRIASFMQAGPGGLKGNMIDGSQLTDLIEEYLRSELHVEQSRAAARAVGEHLRQRNFILCFVGADSFGFVHRTFLEYFCAADIVHRFNITKQMDESGLIALFDRHCRDDEWREVLRLICGQIDEQFVGRIVAHLATQTALATWDGETSLLGVPLAMGCLSEARNVARLEQAGAALLHTAIQCFFTEKELSESFFPTLVAAASELGPRWPGKAAFSFVNQYPPSTDARLDWPRFLAAVFDERSWIAELAQCPDWLVRSSALEELGARWPDETTRAFLAARVVDDPDGYSRGTALLELAERWPDETTRTLLIARAVDDPDDYSRGTALLELAVMWSDEMTQTFLAARAPLDSAAAFVFGGMHSAFGDLVFTKDLDGLLPYLDPRKPVSRDHINKAAKKANVADADVDEAVRSLSAYLGWDITRGSGAPQRGASSGRRTPARLKSRSR